MQQLCFVKQLFGQRVGRADAAAGAGGERLLNFLTAEVVFHGFLVGYGVKQHRAVLVHPRQAEAVLLHVAQVVQAVLLRAGGGEGKLPLELLDLYVAEIAVKHDRRNQKARHEYQRHGKQDGA